MEVLNSYCKRSFCRNSLVTIFGRLEMTDGSYTPGPGIFDGISGCVARGEWSRETPPFSVDCEISMQLAVVALDCSSNRQRASDMRQASRREIRYLNYDGDDIEERSIRTEDPSPAVAVLPLELEMDQTGGSRSRGEWRAPRSPPSLPDTCSADSLDDGEKKDALHSALFWRTGGRSDYSTVIDSIMSSTQSEGD